MLAALPFENLAGNMGQERIAYGVRHEIISQLGHWNASKAGVISHTSSKLYRGMQKPITEIRRELKVDFIVEGSIRRLDDGYRITVLLIRVKDQAHLWADIYNRASGSITAPQEEVAGTIAREIGNWIAADPGTNS
jgi:adenylate cyclase